MTELIEYWLNPDSIRKCQYVSMMFERAVGEEPELPFKQTKITEQMPILQDNWKHRGKQALVGISIMLST